MLSYNGCMNNNETNFLWGVVNIGQQTEGYEKNSNWAKWSERHLVPEIGYANSYWHRYVDDHDIADSIGCNALRTTIEWSRIESREGEFDKSAVEHYRRILMDIKDRDMVTVVGLWHWSVPLWLEERYGMHDKECVKKFHIFVQYVCEHLSDVIDHVVVLNEPNVYIATSYSSGKRPPFFKDPIKSFCVMRNLIHMHKNTYILWKEHNPDAMIGSTVLYNHEKGVNNTLSQRMYIFFKRYFFVTFLIKGLLRHSDYIGINYYTNDSFFFGKSGGRWGVHGTNDWQSADVWKNFPEGLYHVLKDFKKYKKPIMILENGKPTNCGADDLDRQEFLEKSISYMEKAMAEGVDVRGYFHYSLCDSYEWDSGYDFKFGLVEIDRKTLDRRRRKSCDVYAQIIKNSTMHI